MYICTYVCMYVHNYVCTYVCSFPVTLNDARWCWKTKEVSIVVVKGSQPPLTFHHVGYSMSYEVSHDTLIVSHTYVCTYTYTYVHNNTVCL